MKRAAAPRWIGGQHRVGILAVSSKLPARILAWCPGSRLAAPPACGIGEGATDDQQSLRDLLAAIAQEADRKDRAAQRRRRAEPYDRPGTPTVSPHCITRNTGRAQCVHTVDLCNIKVAAHARVCDKPVGSA